MIKGTIHSDVGFYVGDICYVLPDEVYHGVWGGKYNYKDGVFSNNDRHVGFAVARTAYGDGTYYGSDGEEYGVDAGVIGLVSGELIDQAKSCWGGRVVFGAGEATFEAQYGHFNIVLPSGEQIIIDTDV